MRSAHHRRPAHPPKYGIGRVEAFSDGVIAVAITLLVLDLRVPEPAVGGDLATRLAALWPNYLAYVISFLAIGIMWINHHGALRRLNGADQSVLVVNLLLLLCIVGLPFSTSLFSSYLTAPAEGHLAAAIYAGSLFVTSLVFFGLQYLILSRRPHLLREPLSWRQRRALLHRGAIAAPAYLLAALLGLLTPYLTLAVCILLGLFYLLPLGFAREWGLATATVAEPVEPADSD